MEIYVGNLPYKATDEDLKGLFAPHGEVASVHVIIDRVTGQSKGFGFVSMPDNASAQKAIDALNGYDFMGRKLRINESQPKPREERRGGGGFRSGGGGGGGFRSGGGGGGGFRSGGGGGFRSGNDRPRGDRGERDFRRDRREERW